MVKKPVKSRIVAFRKRLSIRKNGEEKDEMYSIW